MKDDIPREAPALAAITVVQALILYTMRIVESAEQLEEAKQTAKSASHSRTVAAVVAEKLSKAENVFLHDTECIGEPISYILCGVLRMPCSVLSHA